MTPQDWIEVFKIFTGIPESMDGISASIGGGSAQVASSVDSLAAAVSSVSDLGTLALELMFLLAVVFLAYRSKEVLLYVLAAIACFMVSYMWLGDQGGQFRLILGAVGLGLGFVTLFTPVIGIIQGRWKERRR